MFERYLRLLDAADAAWDEVEAADNQLSPKFTPMWKALVSFHVERYFTLRAAIERGYRLNLGCDVR